MVSWTNRRLWNIFNVELEKRSIRICYDCLCTWNAGRWSSKMSSRESLLPLRCTKLWRISITSQEMLNTFETIGTIISGSYSRPPLVSEAELGLPTIALIFLCTRSKFVIPLEVKTWLRKLMSWKSSPPRVWCSVASNLDKSIIKWG